MPFATRVRRAAPFVEDSIVRRLPGFRVALALPACLAGAFLALAPMAAHAANATECTAIGLCYCINTDFRPVIQEKVAFFRTQIAEQKAKGKAIGYLSIPLSSVGGANFGVNRDVAASVKDRIEARYGAASAWILNPTTKDADLPSVGGVRARQPEYMLMWTRVLEGTGGLGEDFDFVWFAGPADFAGYFGLDGKGDMAKIETFFDNRVANDADFKKIVDAGTLTKAAFRNYYALRASTAFSAGAHDEWNIIRIVNGKRRDDAKLGVGGQIPVIFDGRSVSGAELEAPVAAGNVGACKP